MTATAPRTVTGSDAAITFSDTSDWGTGFTGNIEIDNTGKTAINGWTLSFVLAEQISNIWNAQIISHTGDIYVVGNLSYDASIAAGGNTAFGFQAAGGSPVAPASYVLNGATIGGTPALSISGAQVTEGTAPTMDETFKVRLSAAASTAVTVHYQTSNGTALAGTDYTAASGTLTFAPGTTSQSITIATHPGTLGTSENFTITLSQAGGATLATAKATGTIITPKPPIVTVANVSVTETSTTGTGGTLLPAGYLSTSGNQIVDAVGTPVKIAAINWYGLETPSFAPQGLWTRSYESMMNQMVSLGFNTIRLPFSLQLLASGSMPSGIDYSLNPDLQGLDGLQVMDKIIAYAGKIGLKIILDDHRSAAGSGPNADGLWYDSGYTQAQWIADWKMLATRYAGNSTIIGADLSNEPHGAATWGDGSSTDWAAAATAAGDAIQAVNPNWLMIVEGIQSYNGNNTWWGGNLMGVASHPVVLTDPNKVVYSPHDYPSSVSSQPWFSAPNYPNNLPGVWDQYWGYIYKDSLAPVFVGEFGSTLQSTSDQQWMAQLVKYMASPGGAGGAQGISWGYWDWNPTSGDTGGILENDWLTVDQTKMNAISPGLYHAPAGTVLSPDVVDFTVKLSAKSIGTVTVTYATQDGTAKAGVNYTAAAGKLTFAPGVTSKTVAVQLIGGAVTSRESFSLVLGSPSGATLGQGTATATLDPSATAAITARTALVGGWGMKFAQPSASAAATPAAAAASPSLADMLRAEAAAMTAHDAASGAAAIEVPALPGGLMALERWISAASHAAALAHPR